MIELTRIYKTYNLGKSNACEAVKGISFTIKDGEMAAIVGKSGAGKSTIMHIIGCIDNFDTGTYVLNGKDVSKFGETERSAIRNKEIGIVMQDFALVEDYSAIENVMIPLYFAKDTRGKGKKERALAALQKMGVADLAGKRVNKMSGGQKQRVAIARAIVNNPGILLADEPTGALDVNTSKEIMEELKKLNGQGMTIIIITHDPQVAEACGRTIEISDGKIVDDR